jgi:hypothetical protein
MRQVEWRQPGFAPDRPALISAVASMRTAPQKHPPE